MERLNRIEKFINKYENKEINIIYLILTFFSITFLRNLLEIFPNSYDAYLYFRNSTFYLDLPIFYISFIISFVILLHLFTKEKIIKIFKIVIPFYLIILVTPILDLFVSGYKGVYYRYILNINELIDFFKFSLIPFVKTPALTVGLKTEFLIIVFLSTLYVFVKSKKYYKCLFYVVSIVLLFGFYAASTVWRDLFLNTIRISLTNFFFFLTAVQLILILVLEYKKKILYFLKSTRPFVLGHFLIMLFFGLIIAYSTNSVFKELNWFYLIFLCLSVSFGWFLAVALNDVFDLKIDKITNKSRPLAQGKMNISDYTLIAIVSFIASIFFSGIVSNDFLIFMLVYDSIGFVYSIPPLRLRKYPIVSTSLIALASVICTLMGFILVSGINNFPIRIVYLLMIVITIVFNAKDLKDEESDKKDNIWTIPVIFGEKTGRNIIAILVFLSYLLVPFILGFTKFPILSIIFGSMNFLIIKKKKERNSILLLLYFIYLLFCCVIYPINSIFS